jgi:nucleoid-associated protein YgaU
MTSDAKIGLLLGLVFIFIIAFIINGLPNFHGDKNNNELTTTMFNSQNEGLGLAARERKVIEQNEPIIKYPPIAHKPPTANPDARFEMPLPNNALDRKETAQPTKPALPKIYVIAAGDNLTLIAKRFYGPEEGNRIINITRILEANRKVLKSLDEIYEGQKIIIPPLPASAPDKNKIKGVFSSSMFEKVKNIGKRHFSSADSKTKQSGQHYVVQEGDSLWRIAANQLGDALRYQEIAKLNSDILDDEDTLAVGMRLKLPTR